MIRAFSKWRLKWPGDGGQRRLPRRVFLASAFGCLLRAQKAEVSEFDFSLLDDWLTPTDLFFVREHFPAPKVSAHGWKLPVGGAVAAPFEISYEDLLAQPRRALPVTIECAENPVGGGLVSQARWEGVSLAALLEKAQPRAGARFVRLRGADGNYARSVPLAKARHADTLLALRMNGEPLPASHGFPVRAVVPGWYGMDSVKWLQSVEVLTEEDASPFMARSYLRDLRSAPAPETITAMNVKSAFSRPLNGAILVGRRFLVRGAAWAGENRVRQVEVSVDGRRTWQRARFEGPAPQPYTWVYWAYDWKIAGPGEYELAVRATDDHDRRQPAERPFERRDDYELNWYQTVRVTVT